MNVLYVSGDPRMRLATAAGHATHMRRTIAALEDRGHTVFSLIAGDRPAAQRAKRRFAAVKGRLPRSLATTLRDLHTIRHDRKFADHCLARCEGRTFDFIYERATPYQTPGRRLARTLGIPRILEVNSPLEELVEFHGCSAWMVALASRRESRNAIDADAVIVGSRGMRDYLVERGVEEARLEVIYPTAGDEFFRPSVRRARMREEIGVADETVVGFVGSMAPFHRIDVLIDAAARTIATGAPLRFLIVGSGPMHAAAVEFVDAAGIADQVIFTGRVEHRRVPDYCAAMDICVIPGATWYGSPSKLFEYAAAGKPVVAAAAGPIREIIRDAESGILVEPEDGAHLAAGILRLAGDEALRARLGARLRAEVEAQHTWHHNAERILDLLAKTEGLEPHAATANSRR